MKKLILASNSPRRRELLALLNLPFEVHPANVDESRLPGEAPADYVRRVAHKKAHAIAEQMDGLVLAADTIVVDGDAFLGKPSDKSDAFRMLKQLRNRTHQVYTGIVLFDTRDNKRYVDVCRTDVPMRAYSDEEIHAYIATGDPMDKAGAYAIQHSGFHPVEGLQGCYASVMGLPLCHLLIGLRQFDVALPQDLPQKCQSLLDYACPVFEDLLCSQ